MFNNIGAEDEKWDQLCSISPARVCPGFPADLSHKNKVSIVSRTEDIQ